MIFFLNCICDPATIMKHHCLCNHKYLACTNCTNYSVGYFLKNYISVCSCFSSTSLCFMVPSSSQFIMLSWCQKSYSTTECLELLFNVSRNLSSGKFTPGAFGLCGGICHRSCQNKQYGIRKQCLR